MAHYKRSKSCDLERPLPVVPSDQSSQAPSTGDTISSSFVDTLNSRLTDCTTWSTPYVDKQTYRRLTKDILPIPTPTTPTLSFQEREAYNCVDPIKYNPSDSGRYSDEMFREYVSRQCWIVLHFALCIDTNTYRSSSLRDLNPFSDTQRYTRLEDLYDHKDQERLANTAHNLYQETTHESPRKAVGMSHSYSDGSMHSRSGQANMPSPKVENAVTIQGFPYIRFADGNDPPIFSSPRGRAGVRTPSPVKQLEDIREEISIPPQTPPKRSRSPVKQLFGEKGWLGRSTSMKELPSEEYRKTGIKIWGGKMKQRMIQKVCL